MTYEEIRVVFVVYLAVFMPLIIYILYRKKLPNWIPSFYLVALVVCALGWELWFTYGWLDGPKSRVLASVDTGKTFPF